MSYHTDLQLEREIDEAHKRYCRALTTTARREAWVELRRLVQQRSPEQIARMEASKGIYKPRLPS